MSVEMPKPYDRPTPCESEKSYQEGWNDAVAQAQEYVTQQSRRSDQSLEEVMQERDYAENMANRLAAAIAPEDVLGEHSDGNFPWQNALDWAVEKERAFTDLRGDHADACHMRDFYARSAAHLTAKRDKAEQLIAAWERGDLASYDALRGIQAALAVDSTEAAAETAVQR